MLYELPLNSGRSYSPSGFRIASAASATYASRASREGEAHAVRPAAD